MKTPTCFLMFYIQKKKNKQKQAKTNKKQTKNSLGTHSIFLRLGFQWPSGNEHTKPDKTRLQNMGLWQLAPRRPLSLRNKPQTSETPKNTRESKWEEWIRKIRMEIANDRAKLKNLKSAGIRVVKSNNKETDRNKACFFVYFMSGRTVKGQRCREYIGLEEGTSDQLEGDMRRVREHIHGVRGAAWWKPVEKQTTKQAVLFKTEDRSMGYKAEFIITILRFKYHAGSIGCVRGAVFVKPTLPKYLTSLLGAVLPLLGQCVMPCNFAQPMPECYCIDEKTINDTYSKLQHVCENESKDWFADLSAHFTGGRFGQEIAFQRARKQCEGKQCGPWVLKQVPNKSEPRKVCQRCGYAYGGANRSKKFTIPKCTTHSYGSDDKCQICQRKKRSSRAPRYEVEKILGYEDGLYKIRWAGNWPPGEKETWEPESHLASCGDLLKVFNATNGKSTGEKKKPVPDQRKKGKKRKRS